MIRHRKHNITVFTDFDGTITRIDTLQMVLDRFAIEPWMPIENRVTAGTLSDKEALQAEFDLVRAEMKDVLEFICKEAVIDETFISFLDWCRENKIEVQVLSGGFESFIASVFKKFSIPENLPVFANSIKVRNNRWTVIQSPLPKINALCNNCKTHHLIKARMKGNLVVYIGDGNTDRCPAQQADLVYAKGSLAEFLVRQQIPFYHYDNFLYIQNSLFKWLTQNSVKDKSEN